MNKFLVCFVAMAVLVGVQALSDEQKEKLKNHYKVCGEETGADTELVKRTRAGDFDFDDAKVKEFFFCVFKRAGVMNEAGELQRDVILAKVGEDVRADVARAVDACKGERGPTSAESAWLYAKCYHKERPNHDNV